MQNELRITYQDMPIDYCSLPFLDVQYYYGCAAFLSVVHLGYKKCRVRASMWRLYLFYMINKMAKCVWVFLTPFLGTVHLTWKVNEKRYLNTQIMKGDNFTLTLYNVLLLDWSSFYIYSVVIPPLFFRKLTTNFKPLWLYIKIIKNIPYRA